MTFMNYRNAMIGGFAALAMLASAAPSFAQITKDEIEYTDIDRNAERGNCYVNIDALTAAAATDSQRPVYVVISDFTNNVLEDVGEKALYRGIYSDMVHRACTVYASRCANVSVRVQLHTVYKTYYTCN